MPHLIIEVSDKSLIQNADTLLLALNENLLRSNEFEAHDIKSRLYFADHSLVGTMAENHQFISMTLKIMPGRSSLIKKKLIEGLIATCRQLLTSNSAKNIEITVEIIELKKLQYRKFMVS